MRLPDTAVQGVRCYACTPGYEAYPLPFASRQLSSCSHALACNSILTGGASRWQAE